MIKIYFHHCWNILQYLRLNAGGIKKEKGDRKKTVENLLSDVVIVEKKW